MLRKNALLLGFTIAVLVASAQGQAPDNASDLFEVCDTLSEAELIFIGRAQPPVTFRISGEAEIEKARQNLVRTEAEVARLRASLDLKTRYEREAEFAIKVIDARTELDMRRAMYPPPFDLTLIPVHVEQAFRGVIPPTVMLRRVDPSVKLEPGELYLIGGNHERQLLPLPGQADLVEVEYVNTLRVTNAALAQEVLRFLSSPQTGPTILGRLNMHSYADGIGSPLERIRIQVASEVGVAETTTGEDGSYAVTAVSSGRLEIRPLLPADLTIVNKSALTTTVRNGGCHVVQLTAAPNGRVRGRIFSATGMSLDGADLWLHEIRSDGSMGGSHSARSNTHPGDNGTFEFSGVFPGSYILMARFPRTVDGKTQYSITYFPGTPDLAGARPIVVGRATMHDGFDFLVTTE